MRASSSSLVCVVGPQPPPRHGVSAVNEAVAGLAGEAGLPTRIFNTAPVSLNRGIVHRLSRLRPLGRAMVGVNAVARDTRNTVVYCSVSGGMGVVTERPIVWLARRHGAQIVLHHHSFQYLDRPNGLMKALARTAGSSAMHIVLSAHMEQALRREYPEVQRTVVVSNAAFFGQASAATPKTPVAPRVVGHLSNLCADKGLFDVVALAEWAQEANLDFEFRIAGPFEDKTVEREFHRRTRPLKNLRHLGPLYGQDKAKFFDELDLFVFPTRYRNEAEPLVVLEALSHSCPVISYDRGCIASLVDADCGALAPRDAPFLPFASDTLRGWKAGGQRWQRMRSAARAKFAKLADDASLGKNKLRDVLSGHTSAV